MSLLLSCVAREWRTSGALDRIATSLLLENRGHDALTMASKSRVDLVAESTPRTVSHKFLRRRRRRLLLTLFVFFATLVRQMAPQSNLRRANWQDPRQPLLSRREGRDCSLRLNLTSRRKEFSLCLFYRLYLPLSLFYSPFYLRYLFLSSLLYELLMFLSPISSCLTILGLYSTWVLANESHIIVLHSFHRFIVPAARFRLPVSAGFADLSENLRKASSAFFSNSAILAVRQSRSRIPYEMSRSCDKSSYRSTFERLLRSATSLLLFLFLSFLHSTNLDSSVRPRYLANREKALARTRPIVDFLRVERSSFNFMQVASALRIE